jgi:hypothetical protein
MMDFAFTEEQHLHRLLKHVANNVRQFSEANPAFIFTAFCCQRIKHHSKSGFIKIPERLNPRPVHLLVKNITLEEPMIFQPENWLATPGDWDMF